MTVQGINIFSGTAGLGAALTNPTQLARAKGMLMLEYPVVFRGRHYRDAEACYHALAHPEDIAGNDQLMQYIIASKFLQHKRLFDTVHRLGGAEFLAECSHFTSARSPQAQAWEGQGLTSRFIRNLVAGYTLACAGQCDAQGALF